MKQNRKQKNKMKMIHLLSAITITAASVVYGGYDPNCEDCLTTTQNCFVFCTGAPISPVATGSAGGSFQASSRDCSISGNWKNGGEPCTAKVMEACEN